MLSNALRIDERMELATISVSMMFLPESPLRRMHACTRLLRPRTLMRLALFFLLYCLHEIYPWAFPQSHIA